MQWARGTSQRRWPAAYVGLGSEEGSGGGGRLVVTVGPWRFGIRSIKDGSGDTSGRRQLWEGQHRPISILWLPPVLNEQRCLRLA